MIKTVEELLGYGSSVMTNHLVGSTKGGDAVLQGLLLCSSLLCRSSPQLANKQIWVSSSFISLTKLGINTSMIFLYYLAKRKLLACM